MLRFYLYFNSIYIKYFFHFSFYSFSNELYFLQNLHREKERKIKLIKLLFYSFCFRSKHIETFNDELLVFELSPEVVLFCSNISTKLLGGVYESALE